jgi:hypothetical protein
MVATTIADYEQSQAGEQEGEAFHRSDPLQREREQSEGVEAGQFQRCD